MTLEQLGSLGEFVAAVGLVLSLIFVGWEIKKTRRQSMVDGAEERMKTWNDWTRLLLENPDIRNVYLRGSEDLHQLSKEEQFVFDQLMTLRFTMLFRMFVRGTELKDRDSLDVARGVVRDQFSLQPNAADWWRQHSDEWRLPFRQFIDEILRDHEQVSG